MDLFVEALSKQKHPKLKLSKAFKGMKEITTTVSHQPQLFGRALLEALKRGKVRKEIPTKRSQIKVDEGKGQCSRKCELIWLPIYGDNTIGKLTIRLYIAKVDI